MNKKELHSSSSLGHILQTTGCYLLCAMQGNISLTGNSSQRYVDELLGVKHK